MKLLMKWRDFSFKGEQKPSKQAFKHMFKIIVIIFYSLFEHMPNINGHTLSTNPISLFK